MFLALVNEEPGRYQTVEALLEDADKEECEVFPSLLSIVEVAFGDQEKKGRAVSTKVEKLIDKLWHPRSPVKLVDVETLVCLEARNIIRNSMKQGWTKGQDWSIKPPDAIHIATAKRLRASYFFTYDVRLLNIKSAEIDIREPFLAQGRINIPG